MNRTKLFFWNSLSAAILQLVAMIVGFIIPKVFLDNYGSEVNGLVTSIMQFISYFNLVEAGLSTSATYMLYKPLADNDKGKINGILKAAKKLYIQAGLIFTFLVTVMAFIYPFIVNVTAINELQVGILVFVLGLSGAIDFFIMAKYRVLLSANQRTYIISIASVISILVSTVLTIILAYLKVDIVILKTVTILAVMIKTVILYIYVRKKYKYIDYNDNTQSIKLDQKWDALYLQITITIQSGMPIIVATLFTSSLLEVSVYAIYNLVFVGLSGILSIFQTGIGSSFGDVIAKGEKGILQKSYREFEYIYYAIISFIYSCGMILIMPFVKVYTSNINDINYYDPILGILFILMGILNAIKQPQGMIVMSAGKFKETRVQATIQSLLAVICPIILVNIMGIRGILIGMCISHLYRIIDLLIFVPKEITKMNKKETILRIIRVFLIVLVSAIPFIFIKIEAKTIIELIYKAIPIAAYCAIISITVNWIFEKKLFLDVLGRIKTIFKGVKI